MSYDTKITRSMRNGVQAETRVPLGFDNRELRISTGKRSRGLSCFASVVQLADEGATFSFRIPGDYNVVLAADPAARCTSSAVKKMHDSALARIGDWVAAAKAHYNVEVKA
jgi:hypothetical protein